MEERLGIPMCGGKTEYTYAWRGDSAYLCMEERLGIPMCGGKTEHTYAYSQSLLHA
jgi:selenophosphate synthetase-related protein